MTNIISKFITFHPQQVKIALTDKSFCSKLFSQGVSSLKQIVHSEIRDVMRQFDIYDFKTISSSGRSLSIQFCCNGTSNGISREYSTNSILT